MSVLEGILFGVVCVVRQPCVTTMEIADRPGRESIVVVIERASERDLKARPYMPPPIMIQTIRSNRSAKEAIRVLCVRE